MDNKLKVLLLLIFAVCLSACGDSLGTTDPTTTDPTPTDPTPTDPNPTVPVVSIGTLDGSFSNGVATVAIVGQLSARGSTTITVDLVDETGNLYLVPAEVEFSSPCVSQDIATLSSPVYTSAGRAISTYNAQGCVGSDVITASVTTGSGTVVAIGTVSIAAPGMGVIEHVSVSPELIVLKGTGGIGQTEISRVTFRAVDEYGQFFPGRTINFSVDPETVADGRGPTLVQLSGVTDANGEVVAFVNSGTIPMSISVVATDPISKVQTMSSGLVIARGIPDQDSFNIAADILNPRAWAWDYVGEIVKITAFVGGRGNHPVPDGTLVLFRTEGGMIQPSCNTENGKCSVEWTGTGPYPCGQILGFSKVAVDNGTGTNNCIATGAGSNSSVPLGGGAPLGQPYGGRATVTAVVVGEESFDDVDNDDFYDFGELWDDLPEPFIDTNEDGIHDPREQHFELDNDGIREKGDGVFTGIVCDGTDCTKSSLYLSDSLVIVMSGDDAFLSYETLDSLGIPVAGVLNLTGGTMYTVNFLLSDLHNQPLPFGTTVSVSATHGVVEGGDYTLGSINYNGAIASSFTITGSEPDKDKTGIVTITVKVPGVDKVSWVVANVQEDGVAPVVAP